MRNALRVCVALTFLVAAAAYADRRPHEGKVTRVDPAARVIQVQGEHGDTWTLNVSETAKLKHNVTLEELQPGDSVHFDYVEKDGQMWITELRRTHKAKD